MAHRSPDKQLLIQNINVITYCCHIILKKIKITRTYASYTAFYPDIVLLVFFRKKNKN